MRDVSVSMSDSQQEASWGRFFVGCLTLIVIFGGIGGTIYHFATRTSEMEGQVRAQLLDPYWAALGTEKYPALAESISTPERLEKAPPDKVQENFQAFSKEHGAVRGIEIKALNKEMVIGDERSWLRVKALMEFEDGRYLPLTYKLLIESPGIWRIDEVTTRDRGVDPPYW